MAKLGQLLGTSGGVDGEEVERLLLEFGWTRMHDELVSGIERGDDCVSRQCGEVGEKGLQAMHRQAIRRRAMGLFGDGRGRGLRLGDDAGAQGRIASLEMLPDTEPLPHLICSRLIFGERRRV